MTGFCMQISCVRYWNENFLESQFHPQYMGLPKMLATSSKIKDNATSNMKKLKKMPKDLIAVCLFKLQSAEDEEQCKRAA